MKEYCKKIVLGALRMRNFIHLHFFSCMSNLFMSYLHISEVDAMQGEEKSAFNLPRSAVG